MDTKTLEMQSETCWVKAIFPLEAGGHLKNLLATKICSDPQKSPKGPIDSDLQVAFSGDGN